MAENVVLTLEYPAEQQDLVYDSFASMAKWTERVPSGDPDATDYDADTGTIPNPESKADVVHRMLIGYVMAVVRSEQIKAARNSAADAAKQQLDALESDVRKKIKVTTRKIPRA